MRPQARPPSRPSPTQSTTGKHHDDPDPLDVQVEVPPALRTKHLHPAVVREHREIYIRGYVAGLAAPVRRRHGRFAWVATILATIALVLAAFWAGHVTAAPRPAVQVTPSELSVGSLETEPALRTEAPSTPVPSSAPAPQPSGGIGEPASYCKPGHCETPPRPAVSRGTLPGGGITGSATWYDWHPGEAAAGPGLRDFLGPDWRGTTVTVISPGCTCRPVAVVLTDWCLCRDDRIIDLDAGSFAQLSDLRRGIIRVQVLEGDWTQ